MRAHNSEHRDSLPVLDITALKHVAYVLDALIYYMRSGNEIEVEKNETNPWDDQVSGGFKTYWDFFEGSSRI